MYVYKFVQVKLKTGMFSSKPAEDYHKIIEDHANEGWRLVQIFTPPLSYQGNASQFELVFEKPR